MLLANITQLDRIGYIQPVMLNAIHQTLALAASHEQGEFEIDGKDVFVILMQAETKLAQSLQPEIHQDYLDIQIVLAGEERYGYAIEAIAQPERYSWQGDLAFIPDLKREQFVTLQAGDLVVFYPGEAHRPMCAINDEIKPLRKAVIKIHRSRLLG
ncbi:Toxin-antitoxin biofilm protein TabA [Vibrio stylophorae]|uniref:Toxin-antitoxin biofilm protein TabA n=1 Tax=Vibrio stylophorae TaxID=659351 RepID=A0ABN8DTU4_9VIBR|nr:YhcH/YjgK/YiaL family protein [Vibrio stylophorae]CAH0533248.1 Toxin-antitoxin biofilm protein TabA [Vibrio stylophorae]